MSVPPDSRSPYFDRPPKKRSDKEVPVTTTDEAYYKLLVEAMGAVVWASAPEAKTFSYINTEVEALLGYPRNRWLEEEDFWNSIIYPEDKELVEQICTQAQQCLIDYEVKYRLIASDGSVKYVRELVRVVKNEKDGFKKIGVMLDETEQVKQHMELERAYLRFTKAFHSCPIPATISSLKDGIILDVNQALLEASGYRHRDELIGKSATEIGTWVRKNDRAVVSKILKEGQHVRNLSVKMRDANQIIRNVQLSATCLDLQQESVMLLMYVDISDQKRIQHELEQANRELEVFMYKSSHNLKGPVASMKGLIDLALSEVQDPVATDYIKMIEKSNTILENTLEELLDITRIKQGGTEISEIAIPALIDEVEDKLRFIPEIKEIELVNNIADNAALIHTDKNLLISIVQNLIENSIKYRDKGKSRRLITIDVKRKLDGSIMLAFTDNGLGIQQEKIPHLFEMFYRGHEQSVGTGLGLYIVKNSVDKLGGSIQLVSEYGKGTSVQLTLPDLK